MKMQKSIWEQQKIDLIKKKTEKQLKNANKGIGIYKPATKTVQRQPYTNDQE